MHLMKTFSTFFLFILPVFLSAQEFHYPVLKHQEKTITDFIPQNWTLHDSASGDLNKDGKKDYVLVLQYKDSVTLVDSSETYPDTVLTQPRLLAILFYDPASGNYQLAEQNNTFILNQDNPFLLDPFESIQIENGVLVIKFSLFYSMGSWYITNTTYKFRYQHADFALIGADNFSINRATHDFEESSYNFLTGKWSLKTGNDDSEKTPKTEWHKLAPLEIKTLKTFQKPFTWEVTKDVYL